MAPGPWAILSGSTARARRTCVGAAPLAGVDGDPQAALTGRLEGCRVEHRIGVGLLGSGQVPAGQPVIAELHGHPRELEVRLRIVRAEGRADEPDHGPGPERGGLRPGTHGADPVGQREAARHMEERTPADLDVADTVGGLGLDELGGDPLERLGVLHQGDRQIEGAQQLGLRCARHRRDQRVRHAEPVARSIDVARAREVQGGVDTQRAVQVEMELGLGHGLEQAAERGAGHGRFRVGHGSMLRFRRPPVQRLRTRGRDATGQAPPAWRP